MLNRYLKLCNESLTSYEVFQVIKFHFIRVPDSKFTEKIKSTIYAKCKHPKSH